MQTPDFDDTADRYVRAPAIDLDGSGLAWGWFWFGLAYFASAQISLGTALLPGGAGAVNFMIEQPNRGKRSVGVDVSTPEGHEVLMKLVSQADVFLTNYMPKVRRKLRIDTEDIRARNPDIIIARGTGQGPQGPDAEKGGYDGASFWARGGLGAVFLHPLTVFVPGTEVVLSGGLSTGEARIRSSGIEDQSEVIPDCAEAQHVTHLMQDHVLQLSTRFERGQIGLAEMHVGQLRQRRF